jgi:hypothetical protein
LCVFGRPALPSRATKRASTWDRRPFRPLAAGDYFSEAFSIVNEVFSVEPRPLTTAMMARLMPAPIDPYSIAVAADWSARNHEGWLGKN